MTRSLSADGVEYHGALDATMNTEITESLPAIMIALFLATDAVIFLIFSLKRVPTGQLWISELLGKYKRTIGPGIHFIIPFLERIAYKFPAGEHEIIVPDVNITERFGSGAVPLRIILEIIDPAMTAYNVYDYRIATATLTSTIVANILGRRDALETDLLAREEELKQNLVEPFLKWGLRLIRFSLQPTSES